MTGPIANPPVVDSRGATGFSRGLVVGLLDTVETALVVAERSGRIVLVNVRARKSLGLEVSAEPGCNLFSDLLQAEAKQIFREIESGEHEVRLEVTRGGEKFLASVQWMPEPDWVVVQLQPQQEIQQAPDPATQITVQELLQEREITSRNLVCASLRLQEVNRQKTVFLASAAHELKTPLAVMKGYYDLLLSGSLGKISEHQREILQESKESCDRFVRLVSMFLNYSALESGKLVLQLRENDLRDCIKDLTCRWQDAFQRAMVRLDIQVHPDLPLFKFDYQKVQQCMANLMDNALKHTPVNGCVTLLAQPYFWERRTSESAALKNRRRQDGQRPNSVLISVSDTGSGIAPEFHQEIFEEFVRV